MIEFPNMKNMHYEFYAGVFESLEAEGIKAKLVCERVDDSSPVGVFYIDDDVENAWRSIPLALRKFELSMKDRGRYSMITGRDSLGQNRFMIFYGRDIPETLQQALADREISKKTVNLMPSYSGSEEFALLTNDGDRLN
ncbi:hypothetical protein J4482_00405 [Candidatus Woesearchaeota archaeon]|nr:hypothetical protein [Candidatus Woesearchaeota archaeon]